MAEIIVASNKINLAVLSYCVANNLRLIRFGNKVPIDSKYAEMFDWARKVEVCNISTNNNEIYLFLGKKAKISGYCVTDVRKIS